MKNVGAYPLSKQLKITATFYINLLEKKVQFNVQIYTSNITMKHEGGEPFPSSNDLSLHNRDDFNASPQIYKYKKKV